MYTRILKGAPRPWGATAVDGGFNFSLPSVMGVQKVCLRLFDSAEALDAADTIPMTFTIVKLDDKEYKVWHVFVGSDASELLYQYEVDETPIVDPCGKEFTGNVSWDSQGRLVQPKAYARKDHFDWGNDERPNIPMSETVVYELNPRHFTDGGYNGIVERADYLLKLCTTVEMMPLMQGDPDDVMKVNPRTGQRNKGSWCYNTWGFYAPDGHIATRWGRQVYETKSMVKGLHAKKLEVIMDVVFNHTREGNESGPVIGFKALGANEFYFVEPSGKYQDEHTGCGNTFNPYSPLAIEFILDCLRYWYREMHVDGFRFDLWAVLAMNPTLVERILNDPELNGCKIFPEPWDCKVYMVGNCGNKTAEWNGKFRDDVRDFWRGQFGKANDFLVRLAGSPDLFQPWYGHWSVNFVTCHDGFTLADLVAYNTKRNLANGENNNDGENHNRSWNCGPDDSYDGPLDPSAPGDEGKRVRSLPEDVRKRVLALREKQKRNFIVTLFLSQGVPLLLYGDECGRTQNGNNNAYCQPELCRMPWENVPGNELLALVRLMKRLRQMYRINDCQIRRHGVKPGLPDTSSGARFVAQELFPRDDPQGAHLLWYANAHDGDIGVQLPPPPAGTNWEELVDTTQTKVRKRQINGSQYTVRAQSTVVLVAR